MRTTVLVGLAALGAATIAPAGAAEDRLDEAQAIGVLIADHAAELPIATVMVARSDDPEVQTFAAMLFQDHVKANQELLALLQQEKLRARDSRLRENEAADAQKDLGAYWSRDVGPALDQRFLTDTIVGHRELIETFDQELIPAATTPAVEATLRRQRGTVMRHLEEACRIGTRMEAQTAGCPERERGTK